jgi:diaminohydroxyphosphoribosylaminopyrimidine deaminase/5-amino-6-(5-phosphoribosylamino)uracil reductase
MRRAIGLGSRGGPEVRPNPRVGCVLVRDGTPVGQGWHARAGGPHAEVVALAAAGERARGATAYVTLEPCRHHGRTPPCCEALIRAGVARVVVGTRDPHPLAGGGLADLAAAGLAVRSGVEEEAARALVEVFLANVAHERSFLRLKLATTLDGRAAAADGTSRWITGPEARRQVRRWRAAADAVLIGSGTALADNPRLDVRDPVARRQPLRVLLDRRLRLSPTSALADVQLAPTLVLVDSPEAASGPAARALRQRGVEVEAIEPAPAHPWLAAVLKLLLRRGAAEVLCEGGPTLAAALLRADLVDRLELVLAPGMLGAGLPVVGDLGLGTLADMARWRLAGLRRLGCDAHLSLVRAARQARNGEE